MAKAWVVAGLIGLGVAVATAVAAQDEPAQLPIGASISANAPGEWQPADGVEVRPGDAGEFHQRLAEQFRQAIAMRGWAAEAAPAILVFRYGIQATADPGQAPIQLRGGMGSASTDEEGEVLLRLDVKRRGEGAPTTNERVMTVTVSDRRNRVLWQAQLNATVGRQGDAELAEAMVPKVLDYLGRDAFDESLR